ncbi:hypothetical protein DO021_04130 [Desulfobacter hydrogenophilus]|uniref:Uncharacterized protein n=1 Tax=Desulfobacter hydrogenophilus TaxID=2291 RepID=A0A328FJW0_9BACT|nr:hypothetical protein [Desulfobacter hydrogenophilus]NDY72704.1 hypothetical protein [Desulfobacter hydrogenophilus]QBH12541.1 hypothetical protein EYB58_06210 [Desulfobacter hydrogenophilus]RAM03277.1 hypothetical protein DO021_04130 [Desulfobacter hydrogenophilus]
MNNDPSQFTLYSGGHRGAEAEFGKLAEQYGVKEVNFSFEGNVLDRDKGMRLLNQEELEKGNISMDIVSTRLGRSFSKGNRIRKVIQSIFHMVNNGYQIFTVGWILPDKTVKGGTGWGVELGKLFNRPIFVYEQDREAWFSWVENDWQMVTPVIHHKTFSGTGTRNLTEDAAEAMKDLFERSFS